MRVLVTGLGAISSLGNNVETTFASLCEGKGGVRAYPEWAKYNGLHSHLGAPAPEYDISMLPRTVRRAMSRMSEMAAVATFEALKQAGLTPGASLNSPRTLLIMGSTSGSPWTLEAYFKKLIERGGPEGQVSTSFFKVMNHSVAANVAAAIEFNGALIAPSSACATSTQAILIGAEMIRAGLYDVVIAGGADELHYMTAAIFDIVQAASRGFNDSPDRASRPFDALRDGLVVSEGAGVVIMESLEHSRKRGAQALAEIRGGSYLCDGSHMTQSSAETMARCMLQSLQASGMTTKDVDYVNAHATGTLFGDLEEAKAIAQVFGNSVPVSGLKGHLGHSLAACGAIEAIACIKMMEKSMLLPTRNLEEIDPSCADIRHVQKIEKAEIRAVLSNNFAFGGMNTSLLLSKLRGDL
jgi:3-oxoacyl-[acyl-carrier-protein] synthase II